MQEGIGQGGPPDEELLAAAGKGDEGAFNALYHRHRGYVLALAGRFGLGQDDALDVLQDTFIQLLRHLPGFVLTAKFTTWLYPVVKHLCLKRRAGAARFKLFGHPSEMEEMLPVTPPQAGEAPGGMAELVARLPAGQREVVLLRFVDGFSLTEIASALSIPLGTAKSRLHNALASLREEEKKG